MSRAEDLRDEVVARDIRETLANHKTLCAWTPSTDVRGGVAHVTGLVPSADIRELIRQTIYRVRGIHAVWDTLSVPGEGDLRIIDIGCGNHKQIAQAMGVDRFHYGEVDVTAEIEKGLPFADESIDQAYAVHFLEHIHDLLHVMNEIHRVLKPGGILHVMVPNWQFVNAVADPTHVRFFHAQTFKFFCRPYPGLCQYRPLSIATTTADLFADLRPIKFGEDGNSEAMLARFFD